VVEPTGADVQAAFCDALADEWALCGVTDAVVCPGSRSTPLAIALDSAPGLLDILAVSQAFGVPARLADNLDDISFGGQLGVVVVKLPRQNGVDRHRELNDHLATTWCER